MSARENIADDASGVLIEGVLESMAEYYSAELSQKIKRGIDISASKCKFFGGSVPLGYKINEKKDFEINPETAPIVRQMFEMLANGMNYAEIGRYLNERGIKTGRGGKWNKNSFQSIFSNRRYIGKYLYRDQEIDGGVPRIIDDALFAEVQIVLAKYAQAPSRGKAKIDYVLSDKLKCGLCGDNMTGMSATSRTKDIHHYYSCHQVRTTRKCNKKAVRKQLIEDKIFDEVHYQINDDERVDLIAAETYLMIQAERNDTELKRLESVFADNQKSIENLLQVLMMGRAAETILAQVEKLESENKELKACIEYERAMQNDYGYGDIRKFLMNFRKLDYTQAKNRKLLINTLVYKVLVYDNELKVIMHLKGGQHKGQLLLDFLYPNEDETPDNEKETAETVSSLGRFGSPTPVVVGNTGLEPVASTMSR